ncbi:tetraspanin-9-like [Crassostrea virginica]
MGRSEKGSVVCTIKYLFLAFNILIWVLGCGVFAVGIWMQANRESFSVVLPSYSFLTAASLVIIAGTITLVIGFVGCCGAVAENKCTTQPTSTSWPYGRGTGVNGARPAS